MYSELLHIYGPFSINSFGLMIAIALVIFTRLVLKNPARALLMTVDQFLDVLIASICVGVIGARFLCMLTEWHLLDSWVDSIKLWQGGYSILGAIISLSLFVPWYLHYRKIAVLPSLDLFALYAPLTQSIARFGCFFAGCCYGKTTDLPWAITYGDSNTMAPAHLPLHPTQIYSSLNLFIIFLIVKAWSHKKNRHPGALMFLYLTLAGFERFLVDFLRADQDYFAHHSLAFLSVNQWVGLTLSLIAGVGFLYLTLRKHSLPTHTLNESV